MAGAAVTFPKRYTGARDTTFARSAWSRTKKSLNVYQRFLPLVGGAAGHETRLPGSLVNQNRFPS